MLFHEISILLYIDDSMIKYKRVVRGNSGAPGVYIAKQIRKLHLLVTGMYIMTYSFVINHSI